LFGVRHEVGRHCGAELELLRGLVVGGGYVEGLEDPGELLGITPSEHLAHVGHLVEHRDDLIRVAPRRPRHPELFDRLCDRGAARAQLLDAARRQRDDRMRRIVVLLEAQRLPVHRGVDAAQLLGEPVSLCVV
jgi:hypothetical protein